MKLAHIAHLITCVRGAAVPRIEIYEGHCPVANVISKPLNLETAIHTSLKL